jgi:hypothetical protein
MECSVQAHGFQRPATWIPASSYMDSNVQVHGFQRPTGPILYSYILIFLYSYGLL